MITGEIRSKVDRIWDTMWAGGIANPLAVIEQLTYLLFIKLLDALPDAFWRLLVCLSRYGGLRVPSEALALKWEHIHFGDNRIWVTSSKTKNKGKAGRWIPLFAELRKPLLDAFEAAPEESEYVFDCKGWRKGYNPYTSMRRYIVLAGMTPWPRVWHNLRASRLTEWSQEYPLQTACAWAGNTKAIAAGHYLMTTSADWERAVGQSSADSGARLTQNTTQQASAPKSTESESSPEVLDIEGFTPVDAVLCKSAQNDRTVGAGFEPAVQV